MIDYDVTYIDSEGEYQDCMITSVNARTAMDSVFKNYPQARRIISCKPRPILEN